MNEAQRRHGEPREQIKAKVKSYLDPVVKEFIRNAPFAVMATSNANGDCDASPKGGKPGFVKILDDTSLLIPDIAGNKLFQSYENIEGNGKAGLIFMIPGCGLTVRVNGRVRVVTQDEVDEQGAAGAVYDPDPHAQLIQGLRMDVDEVYPHCPRAFAFSRIWDTGTIADNAENRSERFWYRKWAKQAETN